MQISPIMQENGNESLNEDKKDVGLKIGMTVGDRRGTPVTHTLSTPNRLGGSGVYIKADIKYSIRIFA